MNELEKCLEILEVLEKSMRYWDNYVDEFSECFCSLTNDERCILREITSDRDKFNLMSQILAHARREFSKSSFKEKKRIIHLFFVLIAFENFEFDYRETTLRAKSFFKTTDCDKKLRSEEYLRINYLIPKETSNHLENNEYIFEN